MTSANKYIKCLMAFESQQNKHERWKKIAIYQSKGSF